MCCCTLGIAAAGSRAEPDLLLGIGAALLALGVVADGDQKRQIKAGIQRDLDGNAKMFTLNWGEETVTLEPGRSWLQVDIYKWVTRGLIEEPQSFHVFPGGSVAINGEKIFPSDPESLAKLEHEINKRHSATLAHRPPPSPTAPLAVPTAAPRSGKVQFVVKLDHLGHLMIECLRGTERAETGLRGLPTLIQNGLMLKPGNLHIDPLQRGVEIDGIRFECSQTGAERLQAALNARYAPRLKSERENAIEIRENAAAATGFDIHFATVHVGARFDMKGHMSQDYFDILNDPAKCGLLRPGIVLKLSPPYLLIRKKRPDGGEERIPELPDVHYRHVTAQQLQQILNHPVIRRGGEGAGQAKAPGAEEQPAEIVEMRVARNPLNKMLLWLEGVTTQGGPLEGKALSHHNIAGLQHGEVFLPHLDVTLSLDNKTLSILNQETQQEETIRIDHQSSDGDLAQASRMLTAALKPPALRRIEPQEGASATVSPAPTAAPAIHTPASAAAQNEAPPRESSPAVVEAPPRAAPSEPEVDPTILALFRETDPLRIHTEIFRRLGPRFGLQAQEVRLSLPRVFENRRFEVVSFSHQAIESILELRGEAFVGFYLSHINEQKVLFLYACKGMHLEWGPDRGLLQMSVTAEPSEYKGSALLGMAQDRNDHFVFVVEPNYQQWVKPHERQFQEVFAHFVTVKELAAAPDHYTLIWPELPGPSQESARA